jgi:hypothetical protein
VHFALFPSENAPCPIEVSSDAGFEAQFDVREEDWREWPIAQTEPPAAAFSLSGWGLTKDSARSWRE